MTVKNDIVEFIAGTDKIFPEKYYNKNDVYFIYSNFNGEINGNCLRDDVGDNIARYGNYLAEYTALYYVWKNFNLSEYEYVKFTTYRKPFSIDTNKLRPLLSVYDGILLKIYQNRWQLVKNSKKVNSVIDSFLEILAKHNYDVEQFIEFEKCGIFYPCTTFVINKNTFYQLCETIFPILINLCEQNKMEFKTAGALGEDLVAYFLHYHIKTPFYCPVKIYNYKNNLHGSELNNQPTLFGELTTQLDDYNVYFPNYSNPIWNDHTQKEYNCNIQHSSFIKLKSKDTNYE